MKEYLIVAVWIFCCSYSFGQNNTPSRIDNSQPENVVNAIFTAAKNEQFSLLQNLCDPQNNGDDDTKMICWLSDTALVNDALVYDFISESGSNYDGVPKDSVKQEMKEFLSNWRFEFIQIFKNGKIIGTTKYMNGFEGFPDIPAARIKIQYRNLKGNLVQEFAFLIQREQKWYLVGI